MSKPSLRARREPAWTDAEIFIFDVEGTLAQVRCPALVLCGSADKVTPPALSTELSRLIPGARLELVEGAGHLSNLEQPQAFNTFVGAFIRGVDSHS